jgi:hypothetical protein
MGDSGMSETPRVFTMTPPRDWVIVRKCESPLAPTSPIYRVSRDPNRPEYGIVLKIGEGIAANEVVATAGVNQPALPRDRRDV